MKKPVSMKIKLPLLATAANAPLPEKLPTIMLSAVL